jgi:hypothetical protein
MDTRAFKHKRRARLFRQIAEDSGFGREPKTEPVPTRIRHAVDAEHLALGHDTERNPLPEESMTQVRNPLRTTRPSGASSIGKPTSTIERPGLARLREPRKPYHGGVQERPGKPVGGPGLTAPDNVERPLARTKTLKHYPARGGAQADRATNPLEEILAPRRRRIFALDPNYRPTTRYDDSRGSRPLAASAPVGEGTSQMDAARGKPVSALAHYQSGPSQTGVAGPPDTQVIGAQVGGGKFPNRRARQRTHRARMFAGARQGSGFYQEGSPNY